MDELSLTRFTVCTGCRCTKPAEPAFFRRSGRRSGLHARCKGCDRAYRQTNRVAIAEKDRRWHLANRERHLARMRRYRQENRDQFSRYGRQYYKANKERILAYYKQWREANRDIRRYHNTKRRAQKRGGLGFVDVAEFWAMYDSQDGLCAYCETPLLGEFHIDHMLPLSRGGVDASENYAITCPPCNMHKHAKTTEEYMSTFGYKVVT